jgi:hypothetical protein
MRARVYNMVQSTMRTKRGEPVLLLSDAFYGALLLLAAFCLLLARDVTGTASALPLYYRILSLLITVTLIAVVNTHELHVRTVRQQYEDKVRASTRTHTT